MLDVGTWPSAFLYHTEDIDFKTTLSGGLDEADDERDRKRQRRSIFFAGPIESDSDDERENVPLCQVALDCLRPESLPCVLVPSTPYTANALSKGSCILTPNFSRHCSSPSTSAFVAVHEEPNAGYRNYMEDRSAAMTSGGVAYLGVYDGHGGIDASNFLQEHLLPNIKAHMQPGCDLHDALKAAYSATNFAFRATGSIQGSTATTVILERRRLIAANVGDSPAFVIKKSGEVYSVIQEHKIEGEEAARIAAHGAPIYRSATGPAYMGTPDGTRWLNMSRAFGDFVYPAISCEPYVCSLDVSDGKYLVIGSDGLTEKWSVAEAAQCLTQLASSGASLATMCRSLVERSLARGSTDNISCMVVDLEAYMRHSEESTPTQMDAEGAAAVEAVAATVERSRSNGGLGHKQFVSPSPLIQQEQPEQRQQHTPAAERQRWSCEQSGALGCSGMQDLVCKETPIEEQQQRSPCRQLVCTSPLGSALATAAAGALSGSSCGTPLCGLAGQSAKVQNQQSVPEAATIAQKLEDAGITAAPDGVGGDDAMRHVGAAVPSTSPRFQQVTRVPEAKL